MRRIIASVLFTGVIIGTIPTWGTAQVTPEEMQRKEQCLHERLLATDAAVVSFVFDGRNSNALLRQWARSLETKPLENGRTQHVLRWLDPASGLEVRLVAVEYSDFPVLEWTAYFKNLGTADMPLLEKVQAIDVALGKPKQPATLRTVRGDNCSAESYEPLAVTVQEKPTTFAPVAGRPSNSAFPYFNLDFGQEGIILALGWPGQWAAQFVREAELVRVRGGQELTHLKLRPGEEIRTPLVVMLFWKGDWLRGQNLWRRWMVTHNVPRPGGKLPGQFTARGTDLHQSAVGEKAAIDACLNAGVKYDYWWIDAGWYEGPDWWSAKGVGTWTPDSARFPKGIREVADHVHANGMKLVLWFEPERVFKGSWLWDNHPQWLLKWNDNSNKALNDLRLLNLGNPEARQWLTNHVSNFITKEGVDLYRQDHNVDPLSAWRNHDQPERQGMTENLYVQGYLAYWDALSQRHPGMLIDSCASGGRRNDLETLRRAVPLLRSDFMNGAFAADPAIDSGNQCHTYGMSLWVPYYGTGVVCLDTYAVRSHLCPALVAVPHQDNWNDLKQRLADYRKVADYFYGDYYPLTPYSRGQDTWIAWEFIRPEQGDGIIQAFRRAESPHQTARLRMRGLNAEARYLLTDIDCGKTKEEAGKALMDQGIQVEMPKPRSAAIFTFREIR